jgi:hypothetical protein
MCIFSHDMGATDNFYAHVMVATKGAAPRTLPAFLTTFSRTQFVEVLPLPPEHTISRMACVAYNTTDASALRLYVRAHGADNRSELRNGSDDSRWFDAKDPEGNEVQFIQPGRAPVLPQFARPIANRIIHVGISRSQP